jgi:hypothetical protein
MIIMTTEIPDDVIAAAQNLILWAHGCEDPVCDVTVDDVLVHVVPVFERWLTHLRLMPRLPDISAPA